MGTLFSTVYNRFLGKVTDDMYLELTPQDTLKDLQNLIIDAIPGFEFPRKNLYDYTIQVDTVDEDSTTSNDFIVGTLWGTIPEPGEKPQVLVDRSTFGCDLTEEEINILAILMMCGWVQRQVTSIENTRMKYSGSDFKFTSQANHLSKLLNLLSDCQRQSHHLQRLYKRRRLNDKGEYESTWDMFKSDEYKLWY